MKILNKKEFKYDDEFTIKLSVEGFALTDVDIVANWDGKYVFITCLTDDVKEWIAKELNITIQI